MTSRSSSRSVAAAPRGAGRGSRPPGPPTRASRRPHASPPDRAAARSASPARRSADRRRLRASLATIRSSHGRNGASDPEAGEGGVGLEERVLDGIGGIGLRGDEVGGAHGDVLVAPHERLVGGDVTSPGAADQFGVVQCGASALNRTRYTTAADPVPSGSRAALTIHGTSVEPAPVEAVHRPRLPPLGLADPPVAVEAHGSTIRDADGREYLDAAGGAIVVNVGHGRREIAAAMADQAGRLAYAHGSAFTTEPLEAYAARGRPSTCRSTTRRSTRCRAAPRRSRRRSSWPAPTTSPAARPTLDRLSRAGGATTATPSARSTCPGASRCAGRTRAGSAASGTSRRPTRTGPAIPGANALGTADELAAELDRAIEAAGPGPSPRSSPSRSSARRWPPPSRPTATGRPSPRSAGATACCSSPTRS